MSERTPNTARETYIIVMRNAPFLIQQLDADMALSIASDWQSGAKRGAYRAYDEAGVSFPLLLCFADVVAMTHDRLAWEHVNDRTAVKGLLPSLLAR